MTNKAGRTPAQRKDKTMIDKDKTLAQRNLALWERWQDVPSCYVGKYPGSGGGSSYKAQALIRDATEEWGPMGDRWRVVATEREVPLPTGEVLAVVKVVLTYPTEDPEVDGEIMATSAFALLSAKGRSDTEAYKKAQTNATSKALSQLGFAASIYMGWLDKFPEQWEKQRQARIAGNP